MINFWYGHFRSNPFSVWFTSGIIYFWSASAPDILDFSSTTCHLKLPQCYGFLYCIHCKKGQKGRQRPRDATLITTEERISLPYPMGNFSKKREFAGALNLIHIIFLNSGKGIFYGKSKIKFFSYIRVHNLKKYMKQS